MQFHQSTKQSTYNFPVALEDAFDCRGNPVPKTKLVVRQDTHDTLSVVSDRYRLITHEEAMAPVAAFAKKLGKAEVAYSLEKNGARLVVTHTYRDVALKLPGHRMPGADRKVGDVVALRTYATNSYNTTTPFEFQVGALVLKCLNGATVMDALFSLRFRHIGEAQEITFPKPELVFDAFKKQGEIWAEWSDVPVRKTWIKSMVEQGFALQLMTKKSYQENVAYFDGADTVWDLYNAFTYVITHSKRARESGKLTRFDRLNALFSNEFKVA